MRKFSMLLTASVAVALLAGCGDKSGVASSGGSAASEKAVTLRLDPKQGDVFNYTATMKMFIDASGQQMEMNMSFDSTREVTKVEDGKITIKESAKNPKVTGTGMMATMAPQLEKTLTDTTSTKVYDSRNKVVEGDSSASAASGSDFSAVFPEKPIKAGDTWSDTIKASGTEMKVNFTANGVEQVDGTEAMKIVMEFAPDNPMKFKGPLSFWVDVENGMPVKAEGKITGEQQGQKLTLEISMKKA